jgi:hypothetical protein
MWTLDEKAQSEENVMRNKPKRGNSTSIKREGMKHMLCFLMLYKYLVRIYMIKNFV